MLFLLRANLLLMIHLLLGFGKIVRLVLRFRLIFEDRINGFVVCFRIVFFLDLVCFGRLGLFVFLVLKFLFLSEFDNLNWILYPWFLTIFSRNLFYLIRFYSFIAPLLFLEYKFIRRLIVIIFTNSYFFTSISRPYK